MRRGRARVCCVCKKRKRRERTKNLLPSLFSSTFFFLSSRRPFFCSRFSPFPQRSFPLWYVSALLFPLEPSKTPISVQQCQKREERVAQESG